LWALSLPGVGNIQNVPKSNRTKPRINRIARLAGIHPAEDPAGPGRNSVKGQGARREIPFGRNRSPNENGLRFVLKDEPVLEKP
jgi:hypothetical protein